jgi:hypothetical protein
MKLFYRISDKSYEKAKLIGTSKETCLMNFCQAFSRVIFPEGKDTTDTPMRILADRCDRSTIKLLTETGLPVTMTDLGNAGSFRKALDLALEYGPNELVYFCEDDYLHLPSAPTLLEEGIKRADYVTLYDHPDKYTRLYNGGEFSKVIRTESSHWRYTASTCMTFAAKVKTLKEDYDVWCKYTNETHPHDHQIFTDLVKRNRRLAVCIPGVACHTDLTFSGAMAQVFIDSWAIDMMIQHTQNKLDSIPNIKESDEMKCILSKMNGWQKLVMMDAMLKNLEKTKDASI